MLRGFRLQLAGAGDPGHQGEVDAHRLSGAELVAQLADGFEERQALDVADGAADLDEAEIEVVGLAQDRFLDRVGDVRDHLHGGAEVVAAAFARDDLGVDAAGGRVVGLGGGHAGEAFVVAEVEVGLSAVVGHVHLAVLVRAHRPGIDVEVGVELAQPHAVAARLQQGGERRAGDAFAEGGDHAAGDEYEPRHGRSFYTAVAPGVNPSSRRSAAARPLR